MQKYYVRWSKRKNMLNTGTNWFFRFKINSEFRRIKFTLGILGLQIWFFVKDASYSK